METLEVILLIVSGLLIIAGAVGSALPILPGPPLAYAGILVAHFFTYVQFSVFTIVLYGLFTAIIVVADYLIPSYWVKKTGGTQAGSRGSIIGMIVGIVFFPPLGMLLGTFLGAVIGEILVGRDNDAALKSGVATFLGFIAGTILKLSFCLVILIHFIIRLF